MNTVYKTLAHTLELVVLIGIAYVVTTFFNLDTETNRYLLTVVLAGIVKFARASEKSPLKDYVND